MYIHDVYTLRNFVARFWQGFGKILAIFGNVLAMFWQCLSTGQTHWGSKGESDFLEEKLQKKIAGAMDVDAGTFCACIAPAKIF